MASAASKGKAEVVESTTIETGSACNLFRDTLNTSAQRMEVLRGKLGSYQRQILTYTPEMKVVQWQKQKEGRCTNVFRVALNVFLIPGSQAENE